MDRISKYKFDSSITTTTSESSGEKEVFKVKYAVKLQDLLYQQMKDESEFCDATLIIGDAKVKAHWCVLVGCPFFQSLHDSGMKEMYEGSIKLNFGSPDAMKEALKFLYLGTVHVNYENVKDLLAVAEYLQITEMKKCCSKYLSVLNFTDSNCVQISLLSSLYDLDLYNSAFQYLRGHLPTILEGEDALTLTKESVLTLIKDETLSYVPQVTFLKFINKWTNEELEVRKDSYSELFTALKLDQISRAVLQEQAKDNSLVSRNEDCKTKVDELLSKYESGEMKEHKNTKEVILVCGGSGPEIYIGNILLPFSHYMSLNNVFAYIIEDKRWTELPPMPSSMRRPVVASDSSANLFIYDKTIPVDSSRTFNINHYDVEKKSWSSIKVVTPENIERFSFVGMVVCRDILFILASGGLVKPTTRSASTSNYFLLEVVRETGQCLLKCSLFPKNMISEATVGVIENRYVSVIGSKIGESGKKNSRVTSFCTCYDVEGNNMIKLPKGCNGEQFMFDYNGGIMTVRPGKTNVRVYSFSKRRWEMRRDLAIPLPQEHSSRTDYSFVNHNNLFYIFGGRDEKAEPLKSAVSYSQETKKWEKLEDVPQAVFGSGTCVVSLPTDMIQCHINCPHCIYYSPYSRANYSDVVAETDDEEDFSADENSYDYYSDMYEDDDDDDEPFDIMDAQEDYWF